MSFARDPQLTAATAQLTDDIFYAARQLTIGAPALAADILVKELIPRCLHSARDSGGGRRGRLSFVLGDWLQSLPEEERHRARTAALTTAAGALSGAAAEDALSLLASVGYGDPRLFESLDSLVNNRFDETGHYALSVRCWLSPRPLPGWINGDLHKRIAECEPSRYLITAAHAIGTTDVAEAIWKYWIVERYETLADKKILLRLSLSLLVGIAASSAETGLMRRIWAWMRSPDRREAVRSQLLLDTSLAPKIDLPDVVGDLLRASLEEDDHPRYLLYLRLLGCSGAAQMGGWDSVPERDYARVVEDALRASGTKDSFATVEFDRKEAAWDVLLCGGQRSLLPAFNQALEGETSGYALGQLLGFAATLALPAIPERAHQLIAGAAPTDEMPQRELLVAQIGAIRAAHGSTDSGAFTALLQYRPLERGVLQVLVDALAESSAAGARLGDRARIERLLAGALTGETVASREAMGGALAVLLGRGILHSGEAQRVTEVVTHPQTSESVRRALLHAFAKSSVEVPTAVGEFAAGLLESPDGAAPEAMLVVASKREHRHDKRFLEHHLGFYERASGTTIDPKRMDAAAGSVLGQCFSEDPSRFSQAVAAVLERGASRAIRQLGPFVRARGVDVPPNIVEALVTRLRAADEGGVFEPYLIDLLGDVAPERLVGDACESMADWIPQGRVHLAGVLARLSSLSDASGLARFRVLARLMGDGLYAVRRAAYRSASSCDPRKLTELVTGWALWRLEAGREGPRRTAAECAGWLPTDVEEVRALEWDPEPAVRDAYRRSMREGENRALARAYEKVALGAAGPEDVVRAWKYGVALARVGDDDTIRHLSERAEVELPASVHYWLVRVRKALERQWRDETRKWPEPWFERYGRLETFNGSFLGFQQPVAVSGTLWLHQPDRPDGISSWGGWASSEADVPTGEALLEVQGRGEARVLITWARGRGESFFFVGNGPYPGTDP